jgi:hypothetical protein
MAQGSAATGGIGMHVGAPSRRSSTGRPGAGGPHGLCLVPLGRCPAGLHRRPADCPDRHRRRHGGRHHPQPAPAPRGGGLCLRRPAGPGRRADAGAAAQPPGRPLRAGDLRRRGGRARWGPSWPGPRPAGSTRAPSSVPWAPPCWSSAWPTETGPGPRPVSSSPA